MTSTEIRRQFIAFFESKGHVFVPSSPVVPLDDPTLMFTNAGMNQFKPIFLGSERAAQPRVANTQKCIRAGGKHNDLDDVGKDTYHHTFFEMLGNWSFGDYFKKEAIAWAWELLTKVWGIDKRRLHATYFEGDPGEGLEPDSEAASLWRETTDIDPAHIHPGNKKDNFWEMGETGPCGPCSEIHIDLTADLSGGPLVNAGDARVMEIWNLVFIQFNRGGDGKLTPLPARHVDTGMGFERLCAVLQGMERGALGKVSNYDTDVFTPIFAAIQRRTGAAGYRGTVPGMSNEGNAETPKRRNAEMPEGGTEGNAETPKRRNAEMPEGATKARSHEGTEGKAETPKSRNAESAARAEGSGGMIERSPSTMMTDVSYRVIADHLRCLVFALTDGALPSNEGRGYVLRRILRRAVRYGRQYMDMHEPFLCDLVGTVVEHMGEAFPELRESRAYGAKNAERVAGILREEEESFLRNIEKGLRIWWYSAAAAIIDTISRAQAEKPESQRWRTALTAAYFLDGQAEKDPIANLPPEHWNLAIHHQQGTERVPVTEIDRQWLNHWVQGPVLLSGKAAFLLHDTYGFPIDLTEQMAAERGLKVDITEYDRLMEEARDRARGKVNSALSMLISGFASPCDDSRKYDFPPKCRSEITEAMRRDREVQFATNDTCFYAEQGGQVSDVGWVMSDSGRACVTRAVRHGPAIIHVAELEFGNITAGPCELEVDLARRWPTMQNHTATHVLNWALREVLEVGGGGKVDQKGSLVDPERTRFDFSHHAPLTDEELERIEKLCGAQMAAGLPVYAAVREDEYVDQKKAREINTLRAVFGEKYPDKVRVVSIGAPIDEMLRDPKNPKWMQYSVEFCGGTHVQNTAEIEAFTLVSEEGVAKGVRRVVGVSGEAAKAAMALGTELLVEVESLTGGGRHEGTEARRHEAAEKSAETPKRRNAETSGGALQRHEATKPRSHEGTDSGVVDLGARIAAVQQRLAEAQIPILVRRRIQHLMGELQKEAKKQDKQAAADAGGAVMERVAVLLTEGVVIGGAAVVVGEVPPAPTDALRGAIDWVRNKTERSAVLLACVDDNRVTLLAGISKTVVERGVKAGDLIKEIAPLVGGKGGGRPDMAQGGGTDAGQLPAALEAARQWLAARLG